MLVICFFVSLRYWVIGSLNVEKNEMPEKETSLLKKYN